jgi:protein-S-isoprenylcysteine O-methyltransferase Ste14
MDYVLPLILTLLASFAAPLPFWLILIHILPVNLKKVGYFSAPLFWLLFGYIFFEFNIFGQKILTGPVWIVSGLFCLVLAIAIDWSVMRTLGLHRIACVGEINNQKNGLVTSGIYRFARHPRYVEYALISLGFGLVYGYIFLIWFSLYLFVGFYVNTFFEEKELVQRFGSEYKKYQKRTKRFFFV